MCHAALRNLWGHNRPNFKQRSHIVSRDTTHPEVGCLALCILLPTHITQHNQLFDNMTTEFTANTASILHSVSWTISLLVKTQWNEEQADIVQRGRSRISCKNKARAKHHQKTSRRTAWRSSSGNLEILLAVLWTFVLHLVWYKRESGNPPWALPITPHPYIHPFHALIAKCFPYKYLSWIFKLYTITANYYTSLKACISLLFTRKTISCATHSLSYKWYRDQSSPVHFFCWYGGRPNTK